MINPDNNNNNFINNMSKTKPLDEINKNEGFTIDVFSVTKYIDKINNDFDINTLLKTKELRRKIILKIFNQLYLQCLNKIKAANNVGITDIIFSVPEMLIGHSYYNVNDCLEYINDKLQSMCFDTIIISPNNIFISWIYLELNINNQF